MGADMTKPVDAPMLDKVPDREFNKGHTTPQEDKDIRKKYKSIKSRYPAEGANGKNLIQQIHEEDFEMIDHAQSMRMPPIVLQEVRNIAKEEAKRLCMEEERKMARCLQDKAWTIWKCQKERDIYYRCNMSRENDEDRFQEFRHKYNTGTFYGEIVARNTIMKALWNEYFYDREFPYEWADQ